ncbi:MAG: tetratricopeptide repeat protein [Ferruginibacter sp.]
MKKQQIYLLSGGVVLLALLFIFGKTVEKKAPPAANEAVKDEHAHQFDISETLNQAKQKLNPAQASYVAAIENSVSRGDVKDQQGKAYSQLASFWKDSVHNHDLYVFYLSEAAKLVNSEKNLTFAARQITEEFRTEADGAKRSWQADKAIELFEKAIELNPSNDSLKVELAGCYVFGKGMAGDANETMKGVQQLLQIVKKDPANMQAQLLLGIGGVLSTQYDKAIERLETVVKNQPANLEAVSWLADAYAAKGDKQNAVKWYEASKRMVNNPVFSKEVDERIKSLK